jgi:hypothetical protein
MARLLSIFGLVFLAQLILAVEPAQAQERALLTSVNAGAVEPSPTQRQPMVATYERRGPATKDDIANAVWQAAEQTGVSYEYLIAQAQIESGLNPNAKARTSSATGLFQFIDRTWIATVRRHGSRMGMSAGLQSASKRELLTMRNDPHTAALMAAAFAQDNAAALRRVLRRDPNYTELYMAHFLGAGGASRFMVQWNHQPHASAPALFPDAARANRSIFYAPSGAHRTLDEVFNYFAGKMQRAITRTSGLLDSASLGLAQRDEFSQLEEIKTTSAEATASTPASDQPAGAYNQMVDLAQEETNGLKPVTMQPSDAFTPTTSMVDPASRTASRSIPASLQSHYNVLSDSNEHIDHHTGSQPDHIGQIHQSGSGAGSGPPR